MPPRAQRWAEVLATFEELVDLDAAARQDRLDTLRASDPELLGAVEQLLEADARADAVLMRIDRDMGEAVPEADPLHLVGRTVSHFLIVEPVARGGMGVVYRAEDTRLGRPVALKVPVAARQVERGTVERFRREARAAAALDHPNLCPVFETGETADGDLFYTMPLYEGETLKARLALEGRLPLARALDVAAQLARGLGAAHQARIVHRDLKPGNVMLLPDGAVKILDFGLAKASDLTLTGSWARLGTISYMAPEQVHGHKVDPRADLWALGVVLFEMVTGSRPFGSGHEIGVAHAILYESPPRASTLHVDLPAELDEVIDRCLRKEPDERFQSAEELAAALGEIRPGQGGRRLRKLRRRWRTPLIVGTATLATVAAAGLARRWTTVTSVPVPLAVLPFERVGDSAAADYLAVGLSDGIGTGLRQLRGAVTPSYATTSIYRRSSEPVRQIGAELQVRAVLRGSVRRLDGRVRVDAQLLRAEDGRQLWSRRYERPASELQQLQRDIVLATATTMRIRPTQGERELLDRRATLDAGAWDTYLQGRAIELAGQSRDNALQPVPSDNIRRALALYMRAQELDPRFALARARLALMHTLAAAAYDTTSARREQARVEAELALRLQPGLPEAHEALAAYRRLDGDLAGSLNELGLALQDFPHSADLHRALGMTLMDAGRFDEAAAEYEQAVRLEPGSPKGPFLAGLTYSRLRRREAAMRAFSRAIELAPGFHMAKVIKGQAYLRWYGVPDTLAALMESIPPDWDPAGAATYARYTALWTQRRYADGLAMLDRSRTELTRGEYLYWPRSLMRARLYESLGERELARASYAAARSAIEDSVQANPGVPSMRIALGLAYGGLGRRADAVREARRAMELVPVNRSTVDATAFMGGAVEVFAEAGEMDAAFDLLELLFSMPAGREASVPFLRVWPGFDPLRRDPRFEQLLTRFATAR